MSDYSDIGEILIQARTAQGLSQRELARRLGLHQQQIGRWEREGYRCVSLGRLAAIAEALGVSLRAELSPPLMAAEASAIYVSAGSAPARSVPVAPVVDLGGVISRIRAHAEDLAVRFGVSRIDVYGSFVRGEQGPDSDVDLVVEVVEPTMAKVFGAERALGEILGREVQLGSLDSINTQVRLSVEEDLVHVWPTR